jgi:hypothetical protein
MRCNTGRKIEAFLCPIPFGCESSMWLHTITQTCDHINEQSKSSHQCPSVELTRCCFYYLPLYNMQSLSFERSQPRSEKFVPVRNQGSRRTEHEIWRDSKNTGKLELSERSSSLKPRKPNSMTPLPTWRPVLTDFTAYPQLEPPDLNLMGHFVQIRWGSCR